MSNEYLGKLKIVPAAMCKLMLTKLQGVNENQLWYASEFMTRINLYQSSPQTVALTKAFEEKRIDFNGKPDHLETILKNTWLK